MNEEYIIYKTTNKITGKFYLGVHYVDGQNKKYLGSGKILKQAIAKYGEQNFSRETLAEFDSAEEAYAYEAWLVNDHMINRHDCYNITLGGYGGVGNHPKSEGHKEKLKEIQTENWKNPELRLKYEKSTFKKGCGANKSSFKKGNVPANKGVSPSRETRNKISESLKGKTPSKMSEETLEIRANNRRNLWADPVWASAQLAKIAEGKRKAKLKRNEDGPVHSR